MTSTIKNLDLHKQGNDIKRINQTLNEDIVMKLQYFQYSKKKENRNLQLYFHYIGLFFLSMIDT